MRLHELILEKESPAEAEKVLIIEHYIRKTKGLDMRINRHVGDKYLIEHCYKVAKKWFTENIDAI